jgi:hypothetical protein
MAHAAQPEHNCVICNKPVVLRTAKSNERGKAVHEKCYFLRQSLIRATQATNQRPAY